MSPSSITIFSSSWWRKGMEAKKRFFIQLFQCLIPAFWQNFPAFWKNILFMKVLVGLLQKSSQPRSIAKLPFNPLCDRTLELYMQTFQDNIFKIFSHYKFFHIVFSPRIFAFWNVFVSATFGCLQLFHDIASC